MQRPVLALAALIAGLLPGAALACACCADPGTRFEQVAERGDWEVTQIARLVPSGPARLYLGACGLGCVDGIANPQPRYDVAMAVSDNGIVFTLSGAGAERGTLTFPWPESYVWFGADIALSGLSGERAAALYTEMRLRGPVAGTGDFAQDGPAEAELVLSGFGNMCILARTFEGWSLTVTGAGGDYRLFGRLTGQ